MMKIQVISSIFFYADFGIGVFVETTSISSEKL